MIYYWLTLTNINPRNIGYKEIRMIKMEGLIVFNIPLDVYFLHFLDRVPGTDISTI